MFLNNFEMYRSAVGGFWFRDAEGWHKGSEDFYNAKVQIEFAEEYEYHE